MDFARRLVHRFPQRAPRSRRCRLSVLSPRQQGRLQRLRFVRLGSATARSFRRSARVLRVWDKEDTRKPLRKKSAAHWALARHDVNRHGRDIWQRQRREIDRPCDRRPARPRIPCLQGLAKSCGRGWHRTSLRREPLPPKDSPSRPLPVALAKWDYRFLYRSDRV
jgi:hypothetical protein